MPNLNVKQILRSMKHSAVLNYGVPGLSSYLIGSDEDATEHGMVRLFESDRNIYEVITPHSHRYNFAAYVIEGRVENFIYKRAQSVIEYSAEHADAYWVSFLQPKDNKILPGKYIHTDGYGPVSFTRTKTIYGAGSWYTVNHNDIHSIHFSKGAKVLMMEGPDVTTETTILEPFTNGKRVNTFTVAPWMFEGRK